jgi:hypothetical protein
MNAVQQLDAAATARVPPAEFTLYSRTLTVN